MTAPAGKRSFLFVTWNGGGNVHPALALAVLLQRRGHDVRALGAGCALTPQASVDEIRAALRELLADGRFGATLRALAVDGSGARAADQLEGLAAEERLRPAEVDPPRAGS